MTTAILVTLITLIALGALVTIGAIDKPRKPITSGMAVVLVVFAALQIGGLVYVLVSR